MTRRRSEQGAALLIALALIAFIAASALVSLRAVSTESALQAHERRGREAFFAAQAGMAEAREVVRLILGTGTTFTPLLNGANPAIGTRVIEAGLPSDTTVPWFQLVPWTPYTLNGTDAGVGVDPSVTGANREMNGPDGTRITDYPESGNVRYRVFIVDDDDGDNDRTSDDNSRVWLVAVGEVTGPQGTQPHRSIIRTLLTAGTSAGSGPQSWDEGGEENTGG